MGESFSAHHLGVTADQLAGNGGLGRVLLIPGSVGRAQRLGEQLEDLEVVESDRRLDVSLGRYRRGARAVDVAAVSTGMGCPSVDIVVNELIGLGARLLIRVGTAGAMQPEPLRLGDLVVATGAVRDESASDAYVTRDFPALADPGVTFALTEAARALGVGDRTFLGVVHTKDSLFAREFGYGPRLEENRRYTEQLRALGVLASEMEAAHLFILAQVHSRGLAPIDGPRPADQVRAGAVLAVIGDEGGFADAELAAETEQRAAEVALEAALRLVEP